MMAGLHGNVIDTAPLNQTPFHPLPYINTLFPSDISINSTVTDTITKLNEIYIALQSNKSVELHTIKQLQSTLHQNTIPQYSNILYSSQQDSHVLKQTIHTYIQSIPVPSNDIQQLYRVLSQFHTVHQRIEYCIEYMNEINDWSSRLNAVESSLNSSDNNIQHIADELHLMNKSIELIKQLHNDRLTKERYGIYMNYVSQLEALVLPRLYNILSQPVIESNENTRQLIATYQQYYNNKLSFDQLYIQQRDGVLQSIVVDHQHNYQLLIDQLIMYADNEIKHIRQYFVQSDVQSHLINQLIQSVGTSSVQCTNNELAQSDISNVLDIHKHTLHFLHSIQQLTDTATTQQLVVQFVPSCIIMYNRYQSLEIQWCENTINKLSLRNTTYDILADDVTVNNSAVITVLNTIVEHGAELFHCLYYTTVFDTMCTVIQLYIDPIQHQFNQLRQSHTNQNEFNTSVSLFYGCFTVLKSIRILYEQCHELDNQVKSVVLSSLKQVKSDSTTIDIMLHKQLLQGDTQQQVDVFISKYSADSDDNQYVLNQLHNVIDTFIEELQKYINDVMYSDIHNQLISVSKLSLYTQPAVSHYQLQPSDYSVHIGEHLLLIIQQLESHMSDTDTTYNELQITYWLQLLCTQLYHELVQQIQSITRLSNSGCKQLIVDIEYICNVVSSLGINNSSDIDIVLQLLHLSPDNDSISIVQQLYKQSNNHKLIIALLLSRQWFIDGISPKPMDSRASVANIAVKK